MVAERVPATEAKRRLSELMNRAAYGGERFIFEIHDKPMAVLVSMEDWRQLEGRTDRIARTMETLDKLKELREQIAAETNVKFDAVKDLEELRRERDEQLSPD